jgi:outer membrane immunogenic protein
VAQVIVKELCSGGSLECGRIAATRRLRPGNTGNLAVGTTAFGISAQWGLPGGSAAGNFSTTKTGWVVGGGVETSIGALFGWGNNNWSMKLEYLYVDLGTVNNAIGTTLTPVAAINAAGAPLATGSTSFFTQNHVYEQIIRVGINYRFNYAAVAPYMTK